MAVIATGFFDGVHLGHRLVLDALRKEARRRGEEAVVLTFWPHPRLVLEPPSDFPGLLSTCAEREALLLAAGADRVETLPFTRDFAALSARDYLASVVRDRFGASAVVVGYDNRLGADGRTADALAPLCAELGLDLFVCPPLDGGPVSSSCIRRAVAAGEMQQVTALLGRPHSLAGVVVHGRKIGRTIGFPTANLQPDEPLQCIPAGGVYAVGLEVMGRSWKGMCNIGTRPTVGGTERTVETYIFDFDAEIYDAPLRLHFLQKVRDEHRFPSLDALRDQLTRDEAAIRAVFSR